MMTTAILMAAFLILLHTHTHRGLIISLSSLMIGGSIIDFILYRLWRAPQCARAQCSADDTPAKEDADETDDRADEDTAIECESAEKTTLLLLNQTFVEYRTGKSDCMVSVGCNLP